MQKDWFEAPLEYFAKDEPLVFAVSGRRGWLSKTDAKRFDQRFAMAICIEAIGSSVPLHETIRARVAAAKIKVPTRGA